MNARRVLTIAVLGITALLVNVAALAQISPPPQEKQILDLTNRDRAAQGLTPLAWDSSLAEAARKHVQIMVQYGQLSHQYPGEPALVVRAGQAGAHFSAVAENVAEGPTPAAIEQEWMHSTPHRTNILDPQMNHLGVAIAARDGQLYAVEDFSSAVASLSPSEVEQRVGGLLREHGIEPSGPTAEARKDCAMESGSAGPSHPLFIMRWESSNINALPPQLIQQLGNGKLKTAAVGACSSTSRPNQGFTTYRVAVLLY